jgi:hypothetical protein
VARDADFQRTSLRLSVQVGDLVQRKGTSEWKAIVTGFDGEHSARIVWVDTGEPDACSIDLLEVINENR